MGWVAVVQQLDRDLLALEMVRSGLSMQETRIRSIPLFYPDTAEPITKTDFKEPGAAGNIISQVGVEALIGLIANSIETFAIRLKRHLDVQWEPFKAPCDHIRFSSRPRQFRALNNVFKHQEGFVEVASSKSAGYLVAEGYFEDETYLKYFPSERIVPDFELALYETFTHMFEICAQACSLPNKLEGKFGAELIKELRGRVVYELIQQSLTRNES